MKISQNNEVMTISQTPAIIWVLALFFAVVGVIFIYGAAGGYYNADKLTFFARTMHLVLGFGAIAAGFFAFYASPKVDFIIDRQTGTISFIKSWILTKAVEQYNFDEISGLRANEDRDSDGDIIWWLAIEMNDGEIINISSLSSPDEKFKRDFAFQANRFIQKGLPDITKNEDFYEMRPPPSVTESSDRDSF